MQLKSKENGKVYKITSGIVLKAREVKKKNLTASFLTAISDDGEEIGVVFGYKENGTPSEINKYEVILEKGEKL